MLGTSKEQPIFIPGPAGRLEARIAGILPENPEVKNKNDINPKIGIVCHPHPLYQGTQDNKVVTTIIRAWQTLGLATIRFNFRGVGKSEGHYAEGIGEIQDLEAVIHWVKTIHPASELWLSGFSFGAYIAAKVANLFPVAGLLTVAPPVQRLDFTHLNPACPWIIIQGDTDELTPLSAVSDWYQMIKQTQENAVYARQLIVIKGASHFFHGCLIQLRTEIEQQLSKEQLT